MRPYPLLTMLAQMLFFEQTAIKWHRFEIIPSGVFHEYFKETDTLYQSNLMYAIQDILCRDHKDVQLSLYLLQIDVVRL